jgi:DNA polymerase I
MSNESRVTCWQWLQSHYRAIVVCDFEFNGGIGDNPVLPGENEGNIPNVICGVFLNLSTGEKVQFWQGAFPEEPPFGTGSDTLWVAYMSSAEWGCFLSLGWPLPEHILDLYVEFKNCTNVTGVKMMKRPKVKGTSLRPFGAGLLGAAVTYGVSSSETAKTEKDCWRDIALRGGPWSPEERLGLLNYCANDVQVLADLLMAILPDILHGDSVWELAFCRALLRGRYMATSACMERVGIPIDVPYFERIKRNRTTIKDLLIGDVNSTCNVYEEYSLSRTKFAQFLSRENIRWPTINDKPNGPLDLEADTFRDMAKIYKQIKPLHDLQTILSVLKLFELTVGRDGRNRTTLWAFAAYTSRNQPSNSKFIFGPDRCFRSLIKPPPGYGLAYLDYRNQEFAIAAFLSGDKTMQEDYLTDPYMALGREVGMIPPGGTKDEFQAERDLCKTCVLGILYGQGEYGLAIRLNVAPIVARELLRKFKLRYPTFWAWRENIVFSASALGYVTTVFGWRAWVSPNFNERSIQNFPCQANGAEMLRLGCCLGRERGVDIACPVHDACLIVAPLERLDADIEKMCLAMTESSKAVLGGPAIDVEIDKVVTHPDRYVDKRGADMWARLAAALERAEGGQI